MSLRLESEPLKVAKLLHVKQFNNLMLLRNNYAMVMTTGNGSMANKPRERGWVVYGDDWAKFYINKREALMELKARA
jgi:hypothetical protein